jgi:predicted translin family RNA/ssDNA-binding protein
MLNKKFIAQLKKDYSANEGERRQIGSWSNGILHDAKRITFALHRGEIKPAAEKFKELESIFERMEKKFGLARINGEGSYRAAAEEYAEAKMLYLILTGQKLDKIKGLKLTYDAYLGGICDLTGELIRYATNEAAAGNFGKIKETKKIINEILKELVDFDLTGYLRTKYDQARGNLRKIEQMDYEINIRQ